MSVSLPPSVPSDDRGLLLGDGLFETIRLYGGVPLRLEQHLSRLERGAETVGIPIPAELRDRVRDAVESVGARDAGLRITLTRGSGEGLAPPRQPQSRLVLTVRQIEGSRDADPGGDGAGLRALLRGRLDERSLVTGLKTLGYLERVQAIRLARNQGADEALLRNSQDRVVEGSSSNIFAVLEGTLLAPGPAEGALAGITRGILLEQGVAMGLSVEDRGFLAEELPALSEVMLSSTLRGIVPVVSLEGGQVGDGFPGPVFRELAERFRESVRRELAS